MTLWECGGNYLDGSEKKYFGYNENADWQYTSKCLEEIPNYTRGAFELSCMVDNNEISNLSVLFDSKLYMPTLFFNDQDTEDKFLNINTGNNDFCILYGQYFPSCNITKDFELVKNIFFEYFQSKDSKILVA